MVSGLPTAQSTDILYELILDENPAVRLGAVEGIVRNRIGDWQTILQQTLTDDEPRIQEKIVELTFLTGNGDAVFNDAYRTHGPEYLYTKNIADRSILTVWDNYYKQYQLGTMDEESWIAFRHRLNKHLRDDYARSLFTDEPERFRESFRQLCNEIIAEIENEAAPTTN